MNSTSDWKSLGPDAIQKIIHENNSMTIIAVFSLLALFAASIVIYMIFGIFPAIIAFAIGLIPVIGIIVYFSNRYRESLKYQFDLDEMKKFLQGKK